MTRICCVLIAMMGFSSCMSSSQAGQTTTSAWNAPYSTPTADLNTAVVVEQARNGIFSASGLGAGGTVNQYNAPVSNSSATNIGNVNNVSATAQNGTVTVGTKQDSSGSTQSAGSTAVAIKGQSFNGANIVSP